jgi:hypothetical protein
MGDIFDVPQLLFLVILVIEIMTSKAKVNLTAPSNRLLISKYNPKDPLTSLTKNKHNF